MSPASIHKFDLSDPDVVVYCSECASPYAREVESCVTCGATSFWSREQVLARIDEVRSGPAGNEEELVIAQNSVQADQVREALLGADIRYREQPLDDEPLVSPAGGRPVRFYVDQKDLEAADRVLDELEEGEDEIPEGLFDDDEQR